MEHSKEKEPAKSGHMNTEMYSAAGEVESIEWTYLTPLRYLLGICKHLKNGISI